MRERLDGITALKGLACMGIFASHASKAFTSFGAMGVSLFLIMSGFGMIYGYYGRHRIQRCSVGGNVRFAYRKISKVYPLFVATTVVMLPSLFLGNVKVTVPHAAAILGMNALLIESWLPLDPFAVNSVAWYLCVCALTYFLFPWILRFMERKQTLRGAKISICLLMLFQLGIGLIGRQLQALPVLSGGWFGTATTRWFVYNFPLTRAVDFLIGCNLGYLYVKQDKDEKKARRKWRKTAPILAGGGYRPCQYDLYMRSRIFGV